MTRKKLVTIIAPAHWASYLINGDRSVWDFYSDPEDEATCLAMEQELGSPVDCKEIGFCHSPDYGKAGECCEYMFIARPEYPA
jgi:hypothetical protein